MVSLQLWFLKILLKCTFYLDKKFLKKYISLFPSDQTNNCHTRQKSCNLEKIQKYVWICCRWWWLPGRNVRDVWQMLVWYEEITIYLKYPTKGSKKVLTYQISKAFIYENLFETSSSIENSCRLFFVRLL